MPGRLELAAEADDRLRDHAQILRDDRQRPERGGQRREELTARAAAPVPGGRGLAPLRDRPVRDEPSEVVEARQVDQPERPAQPLDPPAVAVGAHRTPVVERVAPELTLGGEHVGRDARDLAGLEQPRPGLVVGAGSGRRRSGRRRRSARRARRHTSGARATRARSEPGRRATRRSRASRRSSRRSRRETPQHPRTRRPPRGRRSERATPRMRTATCTAIRCRRVAPAAGPATMSVRPLPASPRTDRRVCPAPRRAGTSDAAGCRMNARAS